MSALKRDLEVNYPPPDLDDPTDLFQQLDRQCQMEAELRAAADARQEIWFMIRDRIKAVIRKECEMTGVDGLVYNGELWTVERDEIKRRKYGRVSALKAAPAPDDAPPLVISAEPATAREFDAASKPVVEVDRAPELHPRLGAARAGAPQVYHRNSERVTSNSPRRHELDSIPGYDIPL